MPKQAVDIRDDAAYFSVDDLAGEYGDLCILEIAAHPEDRQDLPTEDVARVIMTWEQMAEMVSVIGEANERKQKRRAP